jgi:hypothetical protein
VYTGPVGNSLLWGGAAMELHVEKSVVGITDNLQYEQIRLQKPRKEDL